MKTLETNDWIILNTIIYKVYTMEERTVRTVKTAGGF